MTLYIDRRTLLYQILREKSINYLYLTKNSIKYGNFYLNLKRFYFKGFDSNKVY